MNGKKTKMLRKRAAKAKATVAEYRGMKKAYVKLSHTDKRKVSRITEATDV